MKKLTMMALLACCTAAVCAAPAAAAETEADVFYDETEEGAVYDETEAETEEEPLLAPVYDIGDYMEINDEDYKDLTIEVAPPVQVSEEEVLSYMISEVEAADLYEETTEGVVEDGDLVNIDYVGTKDGEAFDGGTADNYDLEIGSGSFIDGFEEGLIGQEIGDTVELPLSFPEDYWNEDLAGAEVIFTVTINAVKKLPELTDEIAGKVSEGKFKTLAEYEESVRAMLQENYDMEAKTEKYTALMNQLVQMYKPDGYPQEYIDYYVKSNLQQFRSEAKMYGMELEEYLSSNYGVDVDYITGYFTEYAKSLLTQDMILGTIAEKNGISITDAELDEIIAEYAEQYGISVEELKAMSDMTLVRNGQLDTKVLDWLLTVTDVKEVEETEEEFEFDLTFDETEDEADALSDETEDGAEEEVAFIDDTEAE
jgi:trigger factor